MFRMMLNWRFLLMVAAPLVLAIAVLALSPAAPVAIAAFGVVLALTATFLGFKIIQIGRAFTAYTETDGARSARIDALGEAVSAKAEAAILDLTHAGGLVMDDLKGVARDLDLRLADTDAPKSTAELFGVLEAQRRAIERLEAELAAIKAASIPPSGQADAEAPKRRPARAAGKSAQGS